MLEVKHLLARYDHVAVLNAEFEKITEMRHVPEDGGAVTFDPVDDDCVGFYLGCFSQDGTLGYWVDLPIWGQHINGLSFTPPQLDVTPE